MLTKRTAAGANFTNCLFYQNEADDDDSGAEGGGIYTSAELGLYNCTFARNRCGAADGGAGLYHYSGSSIIKDCVFWGNLTDGGSDPDAEADQIKVGGGSITVTYTCIQNIDSFDGPSNTGENPLFKNASMDDYELDPVNCGFQSCDSSGIDQGNDNDCGGECDSGGDVKKRTRKVNLDYRTYQIDKGALETPGS